MKMFRVYFLILLCVCVIKADVKSSLTFVIDDTSSMRDDIEAVKEGANAIFDKVMNSKNSQIEDFILVTFNDPGIKNWTTTKDRIEFKRKLANIDVHDGGDCPEMAMAGIELALQKSRPGSLLYVFTDASAKDEDKHDLVKRLAMKKQCQVVFVLTGECNAGDDKVFYQLADETYGQVFHLDHRGEIRKILKYVESQINNRKTVLVSQHFSPGTNHLNYKVDSQMKEIIISVSGTNPTVTVTDPDGKPARTEDIVKLNRVNIVRVTEVKPGVYQAEVRSESEASVVVTAETTVHFQHGFSLFRPTSINDTVTRPIPGELSYLSIKLTTEGVSDIILDSVQILDAENNVIVEKLLVLANEKDQFYITADTIMPRNQIFRIAIKGHGAESKNEILRISLTPIEPQVLETSVVKTVSSVKIVGENEITVEESMVPLLLKCKVNGHKPRIVWQDSEGKILESKQFIVELPDDYMSVLSIDQVYNTTYVCRATNEAGGASAEVKVIVKSYFNVIKPPGDATVELDKRVNFECKVNASPLAEITWLKDGREIKTNLNYEISADNSTLVINKMQIRNKGTYVCVAKNKNIEKKLSFKVDITGVEPPKIDKGTSVIYALTGSDIDILCKLKAGKPQPSIRIEFIDGSIEHEELSVENGKIIHIENVSSASSGTYKCIAYNEMGSDTHFTDLKLNYPPTIEGDKAVKLIAKVGEKVKMPCVVDGQPVPTVTWYLNGSDLTHAPRYVRDLYKYSLSFHATENDTGTYVCEVSNEYGSVKKSYHLRIVRPAFIEPPVQSTLHVNVGERLALPCKADGYPKPHVTWFFQSFDSKRPALNVTASVSHDKLWLPRIQVSKQGYYTCIATNIGGSTNITYEVTVYAPPMIENVYPEKTFIAVVGDLSLRVPCKASGNPKPDITWIKDGLDKVPAGTEWYDIEEDGTLVIKNIDKYSAGAYICEAHNRLGFDNETYEVEVEAYPRAGSPTRTVLVVEGNSTQLDCVVPHKRTNSVRWYKDGILISTAGEHYIANAKISDSGIYTCRVSDFTKSRSGNIKVKVGFKPRFSYTEELDIDYEEGMVAVMDCAAEGEPKPEISWWHNGRKLPNTDIDLVINSMKPEDRGQYYCLVRNDLGQIFRRFTILSRECLLSIEKDLKGNQPLILMPRTSTWPTFRNFNGYLTIPPREYLRFTCPSGFANNDRVELIAQCERETNFISSEGKKLNYEELKCKEEVKPLSKRTGEMCKPSNPNTETVRVGYEYIDDYTKTKTFIEVYSVCLDIKKKVPLYAKHGIHNSLADVEPKDMKWKDAIDSEDMDYDSLYDCKLQINTISSVLGRWFHYEDKCCFARRQLVNSKDVPPGLPQKATFSYLNVVPHWSSCNDYNWQTIERKVRMLAKATNQKLLVWTGTADQQLQISDTNISIYDSHSRKQPVSKYLWKVVQEPTEKASLAIIQLNIPDLTVGEAYRHMLCRDICNEVTWMKNKHWRDVSKGYTFCCNIHDFERAFGYKGVFDSGSGKILYDVSLLPDYSMA